MKTTAIRLICLVAICVPFGAMAQKNIKEAFDAIINCTQARIEDSHNLSKNKDTGLKEGQYDIYRFELPAAKSGLVKNVWVAFDKEADKAYVVKKGRNSGKKSSISLYSGEPSTAGDAGISIDDPGSEYIYLLFAPSESEDPDRNHRYAYGFNCCEEDGMIKGKIVVNYATTSEYRQKAERDLQIQNMIDVTKAQRLSHDVTEQQSWFDMVIACLNGMDNGSEKTQNSLAAKLYGLVRDVKSYPEVTSRDKEAVRKIISEMRALPQFSGPIVKELLLQSQEGLY